MKNQIRHAHFLSLWLRVGLIVALLVCGCPVASVRAASTLTVTSNADSGAGSLRQSIADAAAGDTINFDSSLSGATITLASTLTLSKNVTIDGSTLAAPITISGNDTVRVFYINPGVTAELNSLTVANGIATVSSARGGGGIYNDNGTLTITNSAITENSAPSMSGGGINNYLGTLTLTNSTCSFNSTTTGGCLSGSGVITITDSTISDNFARYNGGGIMLSGMLTMTNSAVVGNSAGNQGGGMNISGTTATITNSTISNNTARLEGGGIFISSVSTIIKDCTFSGNSSGDRGGGIYKSMTGTFAITNSTFMNNLGYYGGAINSPVGTNSTITNATFVNNLSSMGGDNFSTPDTQKFSLANSIVYNGDCSNENGQPAIIDGGNNLDNGTYCGFSSSTKGSLSNTNPRLGALTGSPAYYPLKANSPAINGVTYNAPNNCPATDQRGMARPQGSACDIGAYEYQPDSTAPTVTAFTATSPSVSLAIPITLTATDDVAVTGYLITESAIPPSASASGWSGVVPGAYTVTADGTYTLHPWVKDSAGNVSAVFAAPATVVVNTHPAPEIDVLGKGLSILSGSNTPSTANGTDFGPVTLAASASQTFTLQNTGGVALTLSGTPLVQLSGDNAADFSVSLQPTSPVDVAGSTTFTVSFSPSTLGLRQATLSIANDDSNENPYNFNIQGTGTSTPEMDIKGNSISIVDGDTMPDAADHTDFGSVVIAAGTMDRTFTIYNTGNAVLNLSGSPKVVIGGTDAADFSVTADPTSPVAATSGSTTFKVHFDPSATGVRSATLSIANDDSDENPYNFDIQGTGTVNNPPTISDITDKSTNEDTATGSIAFTIGDAETPAASLTVTTISSNTTLVPNGNISLGGSDANRTLNITPASNQNGTTTITVTVNDGMDTTSDSFVLTVNEFSTIVYQLFLPLLLR